MCIHQLYSTYDHMRTHAVSHTQRHKPQPSACMMHPHQCTFHDLSCTGMWNWPRRTWSVFIRAYALFVKASHSTRCDTCRAPSITLHLWHAQLHKWLSKNVVNHSAAASKWVMIGNQKVPIFCPWPQGVVTRLMWLKWHNTHRLV